MDNVLNIINTYYNIALEKFGEHGGISKDTLLLIGGACFIKILLIDIIFGRGGQLICHFIGFVYPAYRTTKALESRHNGGTEEDKVQWLMYWVVFAIFHLVEFFSDTILGWIPMYWVGKSMFLLGCMSPLNLSSTIYHMVVLPIFKKNELMLEDVVADCRNCVLGQCKNSLTIDTTTCGLLALGTLSDSVSPSTPASVRSEKSNSPRPSPKKKRAPLPPKVLRIDDEDQIDQYLNDHF